MENRFARAVRVAGGANVGETTEFYRGGGRFKIDWTWGENDYGAVSRDHTELYLIAEDLLPADHVRH